MAPRSSNRSTHPYGELMAEDFQELPVELDQEDLLILGRDASKLFLDIEVRQIEESERRKEWKAGQTTLEARHSEMNGFLAAGSKPSEVAVEVYGDVTENVVRVIRTDTGAVVGERAMEVEERERLMQLSIVPSHR